MHKQASFIRVLASVGIVSCLAHVTSKTPTRVQNRDKLAHIKHESFFPICSILVIRVEASAL